MPVLLGVSMPWAPLKNILLWKSLQNAMAGKFAWTELKQIGVGEMTVIVMDEYDGFLKFLLIVVPRYTSLVAGNFEVVPLEVAYHSNKHDCIDLIVSTNLLDPTVNPRSVKAVGPNSELQVNKKDEGSHLDLLSWVDWEVHSIDNACLNPRYFCKPIMVNNDI